MNLSRFNLFSAQLLLMSLLWTGCSAKYVAGIGYDGPKLPKDSVATILGDLSGKSIKSQYIIICKVDGNRVEMDSTNISVDVLPGAHVFTVQYGGGPILCAVDLTFKVKEGHRYLVTFEKKSFSQLQNDMGFTLWIENTTTKERIADAESSPPKSPYSCF